MEEEDTFIIIVDEENENSALPLPISVKLEPADEEDVNREVEDLLKNAKTYGTFIELEDDVEETSKECDEPFDNEQFLNDIEKLSNKYNKDLDSETEFLEDMEEPGPQTNTYDDEILGYDSNDSDLETTKPKTHRRSLLMPRDCKSFVADLKEKYPELRNDNNLLVKALSEIMRNMKPPKLPDIFYTEENNKYVCEFCTKVTDSLAAAGRHYQEKHGPRYLVCFSCGVDFRSKTNLYKHEKRCLGRDACVVLKARARFIGTKARSRPFMRPVTPPEYPLKRMFSCSECSVTFKSKINLEAHENMHRGIRPFQCHVCPASYTSATGLQRHMVKHSNSQYICDDCGRSFKQRTAFVTHLNTHKPLRRFPCPECGQRFAQKAAMVLHSNRVHHNLPYPFLCKICERRFPRMSLLKNHSKRAHGMNIITRKMFFKMLPTMPDLIKDAKIVLKSEENDYFNIVKDKNKSTVKPADVNKSAEDLLDVLKQRETKNTGDSATFSITEGEAIVMKPENWNGEYVDASELLKSVVKHVENGK